MREDAAMTYTGPILLTGDQVASIAFQPTNQGNPGDANFGMVMENVTALAGPEAVYRLVWVRNINTVDTFFRNGQVWELQVYTGTGDPATDTGGWVTVPGYTDLSPRNDLVSGVGGGDEYIVFAAPNGYLLYDINGELPTTPETLTYMGAAQNGDPGTGNNNSELDFGDAAASFQPICFCAGTLIETDRGSRPVEDLAVGDLVFTLDHGWQPIRWIGRSEVSLARAIAFPALQPVTVAAGAMGPGLPDRDLRLSPQHRVLVRSKIAARMTGAAEALIAVKHLCGLPGIVQERTLRPVTYLHLRLERHEVVRANGVWAETLFVGPQALRAMGPEARAELRQLFPGLIEGPEDAARPLMPGRQAHQLVARHLKNAKALVGA
jgi:hypothetical protein